MCFYPLNKRVNGIFEAFDWVQIPKSIICASSKYLLDYFIDLAYLLVQVLCPLQKYVAP